MKVVLLAGGIGSRISEESVFMPKPIIENGGGDWTKDRIIPDCIWVFEPSKPIDIQSPKVVRSWENELEPLSRYMFLAQKTWEHPTEYCKVGIMDWN